MFLSAVLALLLLTALIKARILTFATLAAKKDALAAINSILSAVAIVGGSFLAYFRFFRGRTLSPRAELEISVTAVPAQEGPTLHAFTLTVKNLGSVAIWDPQARVVVLTHGRSGYESKETIDSWDEPLQAKDGRLRASVIDPAEHAIFFAQRAIDPTIVAVTYFASVADESGSVWKCFKTVGAGHAGDRLSYQV